MKKLRPPRKTFGFLRSFNSSIKVKWKMKTTLLIRYWIPSKSAWTGIASPRRVLGTFSSRDGNPQALSWPTVSHLQLRFDKIVCAFRVRKLSKALQQWRSFTIVYTFAIALLSVQLITDIVEAIQNFNLPPESLRDAFTFPPDRRTSQAQRESISAFAAILASYVYLWRSWIWKHPKPSTIDTPTPMDSSTGARSGVTNAAKPSSREAQSEKYAYTSTSSEIPTCEAV